MAGSASAAGGTRVTTAGRRGKVRDEDKRAAIVGAALDVLTESGPAGLTMERIAARAGVSKVTLYKWWSHRAHIALDGLLAELQPALAWPDSGDFAADLHTQVEALVTALTGPRGSAIRAVIAAGQEDPDVREAFVQRFLEPRRAEARAAFSRARDRGRLRPDLDLEAAIDVVYGPLYYRLLLAHRPLDDGDVRVLVGTALAGLAADDTGRRGARTP